MKLYYLNSEIRPGEHTIIAAHYDADNFKFDTSAFSLYTVLVIDELDPTNKLICLDLARTINKKDINGLSKYYIDTATGNIMERDGWIEYVEDING